jgi:integrase
MLFKRCPHPAKTWLTCDHAWWVQAKRKPRGRVRESLEVYFNRPVRGKGGKTLAKDLERQFLSDLRSSVYETWKKERELAKQAAPAIPAKRLWTDFLDFYIEEHILANGLRWDWTLKYKLGLIRKAWEQRPIDSITVADVQRFLNDFKKRGCAPATVRYYYSIIRHALRFAAKMQWLSESPLKADSIELQKVQNERTRRLLPGEEDRLWPVLEAMEDETASDPLPARRFLKGVVTLTLDTGLRRGSILNLRFGMVRWDEGKHGVLDVPAEILKQRRPQQIALTTRVRAVLEARRRFYFSQGRYAQNVVVFGKDDGTLFQGTCSFEQAWQEAKRRAGLKDADLHFHDLRGEAASRLADSGMSLPVIQRFLGHRSIEMTQRYLRARVGEIDDTAAALEKYERATKGATAEQTAKSS